MKGYMKIYLVSIAFTAIISILSAQPVTLYETGFAFGATNLLLAGLFFIIACLLLLGKAKEEGSNLMIASGLLLLTGGVACSIFPFTHN